MPANKKVAPKGGVKQPSTAATRAQSHKRVASAQGMTNPDQAPQVPRKNSTPLPDQLETTGLSKLGAKTQYTFNAPDVSILEAFPNRYPDRDYVIVFEHPEFTSLCPMTGQPDFGTIRLTYVPDVLCVESKSFKLYMGAFRNSGSFMESITNKIADDCVALLAPRRLTVEGLFNVRGGTRISIRVEYLHPECSEKEKAGMLRLW